MKNKITRLQRWLDRLGVACDSKRWDSAAVEADCLSAEVREVRDELWKLAAAEPAASPRIFSREGFKMSLKSAAIAMIIVMFSTLPIAVESEKPWNLAANTAKREVPAEHLSWVTDDEDDLLQVLRSGLNANNPSANMAANPGFAQTPAAPRKTEVKEAGLKKSVKPAPVKNISVAKQSKTEPTLPPEDMLALIQAGEKALRGGEPAIKVIR